MDETFADVLARRGYRRRHRMSDHGGHAHVVATRRCRGGGEHVVPMEVCYGERFTPAEERAMHELGQRLDTLDEPVDYERIAIEMHREMADGLPIGPGFSFDPCDHAAGGPSITIDLPAEIQDTRLETPLTVAVPLRNHVEKARTSARRIAGLLADCRAEAIRQAAAERMVERSAAVILANALRDEDAVRQALSAPASLPRIAYLNEGRHTIEQDYASHPVAGLDGVIVRVSAAGAWLVTNGRLPNGFSWNGRSFKTDRSTAISETLLRALPGTPLTDIVSHPWIKGMGATIATAHVGGKDTRARLVLRTRSDRITLDEAMRDARRIMTGE